MLTRYQIIRDVFIVCLLLAFTGCPLFRATGEGVEAVGEGAGHAVAGTGRAISDAAH